MPAANPFRLVTDETVEESIGTVKKDRSYSRRTFYTRSTNRHDHQRNIQTAFPQDIQAAVFATVAAVAEYRSHHDLVRDAVYHRLVELNEWYSDQINPEMFAELAAITEQEQMLERARLRREVVEGAETLVAELVDCQDERMLREFIDLWTKKMEEGVDPHVADGIAPVLKRAKVALGGIVAGRVR